jgi:hypothetical protein
MKKDDFTPDAIQDELIDHTINHDFPADELSEIGSHVYITGIGDIDVTDVVQNDSNFIVEGAATLHVDTDLGEGDKWSDYYPMQFKYEFDDEGKIVRLIDRSIDTSSFFAGSDDYEAYVVERSGHVESFTRNTLDILSLLGEPVSPSDKRCLHRLLYINVITTLEVYLSDFFIARIKDKRFLRLLFEKTQTFKDHKISVSNVFGFMDKVESKASQHLTRLVWHRLDDVSSLYKNVLGIKFPDLKTLKEAIDVRHQLVHRNVHKKLRWNGARCERGGNSIRHQSCRGTG